ncbi:MAG: hypothetical protein WC659_05330, partial [Patescibacteria group bacterium]
MTPPISASDTSRSFFIDGVLVPIASVGSDSGALAIKLQDGLSAQVIVKATEGDTVINGTYALIEVVLKSGNYSVDIKRPQYKSWGTLALVEKGTYTNIVVPYLDLAPIGAVAPTIEQFVVTPDSITVGSTAVLSWKVKEATAIRIDQGIGTVSAQGNQNVSPSMTTIYTLTAESAGGTVSKPVVLKVGNTSVPKPTIEQFVVTPDSITVGSTAVLSWKVKEATAIRIDQGIGTVSAQGNQNVSPSMTTIYTLTAESAGGTVS